MCDELLFSSPRSSQISTWVIRPGGDVSRSWVGGGGGGGDGVGGVGCQVGGSGGGGD